MRAEGITLHKPNVCEANHAYKNFAEYNKACKLKGAEGKVVHKPHVCETKHAYKNIAEYNKACKIKGNRRKGTTQIRCL